MSRYREKKETTALIIACIFLFAFLVHSVVSEDEVSMKISITRNRKYLIYNETTSDHFLKCEALSNGVARFMRIDLYHYLTFETRHLPWKECFPEMPPRDAETVKCSSQATKNITCYFKIEQASISDANIYNCQLTSCSPLKTTAPPSVDLVVKLYQSPILTSVEQKSSSKSVPVNGSFSLQCNFTAPKLTNDRLDIQWRLPSETLPPKNLQESPDPLTFYKSNAQKSDGGWYQCAVLSSSYRRTGISAIDTIEKYIDIQYAATIEGFYSHPFAPVKGEDGLPVVTLPAGANDTLNCTADGNPSPNITLFFNDEILPLPQTPYSATIDLQFVLPSRDDGVYRCSAFNKIGEPTEKSLRVSVYELPRITLFLPGYPHHCLPEHYSETLECRATGVPLPTVSISNSSGYILTEKEGKADCLLRKTHAREQSYTCWASNQYGNFSKNFTMKICSDESSLTIILEAALPSTLLSIFLLLGIMFGVIRKKYQFNKEEDAFLLDHRDRPFKPSKQLKRLARTIAFVPWKDIARAMEPAMDESEIASIIEKNMESAEQGAIQFLSAWMARYPNMDIVLSVHEAANESGHNDIEQELLKGFPFLTISESWKKAKKKSFVV